MQEGSQVTPGAATLKFWAIGGGCFSCHGTNLGHSPPAVPKAAWAGHGQPAKGARDASREVSGDAAAPSSP